MLYTHLASISQTKGRKEKAKFLSFLGQPPKQGPFQFTPREGWMEPGELKLVSHAPCRWEKQPLSHDEE